MFSFKQNTYKNEAIAWSKPNAWDLAAFLLVASILFLLAFGSKAIFGDYQLGQIIPISLDPSNLPYYGLRTVLRMFIALVFSLLFTFIFGTWAAKSARAERLIIPMIDILQSVPVLGYLSITVVGFIHLFRGSMLGPECAAIFAIFTAQVWNMVLSFYQSLKTLPSELDEAAKMFHLSAWQRFWRIEVPFAMPGLLWNTMMSMSASWVFLTASEAFSVANTNITLPGIGSYIALAITKADMNAIVYVIIAMFLVILLYDQLLFRPLVAWSKKFKAESSANEVEPSSWVLNLFQRTIILRKVSGFFGYFTDKIINTPIFSRKQKRKKTNVRPTLRWATRTTGLVVSWGLILSLIFMATHYISSNVSLQDVYHVAYLGLITGSRVIGLIIISSIIWVPIGVWIGLNPRASAIVQPVAQFLAAFPVNLLFPFMVIFILRYHLNVNFWCAPLMILGTQWYILFNVVAGTIALPENMHQAVGTLNVRRWLWWKRFILPGIFPYYITGAITAAGGAWNISVIAEALRWGHTSLFATGLGAFISKMTAQGNFGQLALGIVIMSLFVVIVNYLVWRPLYNFAEKKFQIR